MTYVMQGFSMPPAARHSHELRACSAPCQTLTLQGSRKGRMLVAQRVLNGLQRRTIREWITWQAGLPYGKLGGRTSRLYSPHTYSPAS